MHGKEAPLNTFKHRLSGRRTMTDTPSLNMDQLKQRRDQLCFACGQRGFDIEVREAENKRDYQEILELCQKIAKLEQEIPAKITPEPEIV